MLVLEDCSLLSLVFHGLQLLLELVVLALIATDLLLTHCFLLVDRLVVALVFDASVFFEEAPLVLQLGDFFSEGVLVHAMPLSSLVCIGELAAEVGQLVRLLLHECLVLQAERLNDALVSLLVVFRLLVQLLFETSHPRQVLLLLQKDPISLKVCVLDALLALIG